MKSADTFVNKQALIRHLNLRKSLLKEYSPGRGVTPRAVITVH